MLHFLESQWLPNQLFNCISQLIYTRLIQDNSVHAVAHDIAIRKGGRVPDGARDTSAAATAVPASSRPPTTYGIADGLPSEFWRRSCGAATTR